jgi:hypothetical protein
MSQPQAQNNNNNNIFRTSLRDWQAKFKAKQAAQTAQNPQPQPTLTAQTLFGDVPQPSLSTPDTPAASAQDELKPVRVKRLVSYKRRKRMAAAAAMNR